MNIFKKYKYKKLLAGCDHVLAGEILRENFAKTLERNGTMSSKLIEDYLSDPCLDNAIKLISHDQMMIFYFNECKENGLYKRQRKTKSETAAGAELTVQYEPPQTAFKSNAASNSTASGDLQKTKFPNVVATLMFDCNELSNKIEEIQSKINEGNEVSKYLEMIKKYEEALTEFEKAIKALQQHK
ncbi:MAG: hypothetical protein K0S39_267 [Paenibacillus sp.]|nr:hypothetical protein [Paenibacillus sp.]